MIVEYQLGILGPQKIPELVNWYRSLTIALWRSPHLQLLKHLVDLSPSVPEVIHYVLNEISPGQPALHTNRERRRDQLQLADT